MAAGKECVSESYPMSSGDGQHSYSQNSTFQKKGVEAAKEMVNTAVQEMLEFNNNIEISKTLFCIADFGCSVGPNTLIAVQNITQAVRLKHYNISQNHPPLEFQVFFNDHTHNDFNTLFKNLSFSPPGEFFAAGVPGDFHSRLFPRESLHLGHSSYALHWLSRAPGEVMDVDSPAWNGNSIHCTGFSRQVANAYLAQFHKDMEDFLNARAQELVGGGLMLLMIPGLKRWVPLLSNYYGYQL
ncbi:hypothetical protein Tsubulata_013759 [Turnera subulata]|uniref:S-adenosylmethionine-dependent methyltransferase At5g38100 n=1 Tax=Turnera subulata TaxID=218843 RepID=A0A9Q0G5Q9_9ROSI|nr:hypothetical protein Tsubulata_013759 [Turnera subulata]